jgi:hypothetical protein
MLTGESLKFWSDVQSLRETKVCNRVFLCACVLAPVCLLCDSW